MTNVLVAEEVTALARSRNSTGRKIQGSGDVVYDPFQINADAATVADALPNTGTFLRSVTSAQGSAAMIDAVGQAGQAGQQVYYVVFRTRLEVQAPGTYVAFSTGHAYRHIDMPASLTGRRARDYALIATDVAQAPTGIAGVVDGIATYYLTPATLLMVRTPGASPVIIGAAKQGAMHQIAAAVQRALSTAKVLMPVWKTTGPKLLFECATQSNDALKSATTAAIIAQTGAYGPIMTIGSRAMMDAESSSVAYVVCEATGVKSVAFSSGNVYRHTDLATGITDPRDYALIAIDASPENYTGGELAAPLH